MNGAISAAATGIVENSATRPMIAPRPMIIHHAFVMTGLLPFLILSISTIRGAAGQPFMWATARGTVNTSRTRLACQNAICHTAQVIRPQFTPWD
ncbi:hypothetical protein RHIZ404_220033 [Rhizobium sp. EC-SD404]|nr:hypothetical protein RHIZ404_220033 [Rhizobium sp. EC-SD404]